jgi:hypothetical protein
MKLLDKLQRDFVEIPTPENTTISKVKCYQCGEATKTRTLTTDAEATARLCKHCNVISYDDGKEEIKIFRDRNPEENMIIFKEKLKTIFDEEADTLTSKNTKALSKNGFIEIVLKHFLNRER